jgi:hypothetical protein
MRAEELEEVIRRIEHVEDDVLRLIENHPQLIRSRTTLDVLRRLKATRTSLRAIRGKLGGLRTVILSGARGSFQQYRILRKPH